MVKAVLNRRFLPSLVSPEPRFIKRERERESSLFAKYGTFDDAIHSSQRKFS